MWDSSLFTRSLLCGTLAFSANVFSENLAASHAPLNIQYKDVAGSGVNDTTPLTLSDGTKTTVGAFRKSTIEHVARAVSLQFNNAARLKWGVKFQNNAGYDALTRGPYFTKVSTGNQDKDGFAKLEQWYPITLLSALNGVDVGFMPDESHAETQFLSDPQNIQSAIASTSGQSVLTSIAYHELIHVYGFVENSCLGSCIPARMSHNSHITPLLWYRKADNSLVNYEKLDLDGRETAGKSAQRFLAGGSLNAPRTSAAVQSELTGGTYVDSSGGYVQMFATPTPQGDWDGQAGSHLSFDVQPAQLMYSSAARVQDLGIAAAMLCDAGWCRKTGQVIDISAQATLDKNASTTNKTFIDVTFKNQTNADLDKLQAQVRLDSKYTDVTLSGDQQGCVLEALVLNCAFDMTALSSKKISLALGPLTETGYTIAGEVYSKDYDVDRNGFNNILDTTLKLATSNPGNGAGTGGTGGTGNNTPTPPSSSAGSSGGSMPLWTLSLLGFVWWRRLAVFKAAPAPAAVALTR